MNNRTLTDEDIEALVDALEKRAKIRFYGNIGKTVWDWAWKASLLGVIAFESINHLKG